MKFEEALEIYTQLKSIHGQASCNFSIGFLIYTKPSEFISKVNSENKIFDIAKKRVEDAINLYSQLKHHAGESVCHRILIFIKQKSKEKYTEHFKMYKSLM